MEEPTQDTEQLLSEYVDVWNERDYEKIPDLVSESFVRVSPTVRDGVRGPDGLEELIREIDAGFSDFQVDVGDQLAGDGIAMAEGTFSGTHDGEFNDVPPTEREVEIQFMDKLRIEDGQLAEHRTYFDLQEMLEQLGVTEE